MCSVDHQRTKHIERRHFFIRECVEDRRITVPFVRSCDNLADLFTKPLAWPQFRELRDRCMGYAAVTTDAVPARGGVAHSTP